MPAISGRHRHIAVAGAGALLLTGLTATSAPTAFAAPLNPCVSSDNGKPQIHDISFTPTTVDVTEEPREVRVRVRATDKGGPGDPTGIEEALLRVRAPKGSPAFEETVVLTEAGGTFWEGTLSVPVGAAPGDWTVGGIKLRDGAGNYLDDPDDEGYDFLAPYDDVRLQMTSDPDTTPPSATSLRLAKKRVDNRRKSAKQRVRVGVEDDHAVAAVRVIAQGPRQQVEADLARRSDTRFAGALKFPKKFDGGKWKVTLIQVTDEVGHVRWIRRKQISDLGRRTFRVLAPRDRRAPKVKSAWVLPRSIDVRTDSQRVRVRAWVRDPGTGVREVSANVYDQWRLPMKRIRGNARKGLWQGSFRLDPCSAFESRSATIVARDLAGSYRYRDFDASRVRRPDNLPPRPTDITYRIDPGGPLKMGFNEIVNGISHTSVTVRRSNWPDPLGDPVAGTWACTGIDGEPTSCTTGRVTGATWTPQTPLEPGSYRVTINPDGVLDVTDLAGNPVNKDPEEPDNYFDMQVQAP